MQEALELEEMFGEDSGKSESLSNLSSTIGGNSRDSLTEFEREIIFTLCLFKMQEPFQKDLKESDFFQPFIIPI